MRQNWNNFRLTYQIEFVIFSFESSKCHACGYVIIPDFVFCIKSCFQPCSVTYDQICICRRLPGGPRSTPCAVPLYLSQTILKPLPFSVGALSGICRWNDVKISHFYCSNTRILVFNCTCPFSHIHVFKGVLFYPIFVMYAPYCILLQQGLCAANPAEVRFHRHLP